MELFAACGTDHDDSLVDTHFGDAPKYKIYKITDISHHLIEEIGNETKDIDEEEKHGAEKKAKAITQLLKKKGVQILIAKRFGPNIKHVKLHFVPIKVNCCTADEAVELARLNFERIMHEWEKGESRSFLNLR